MLQSDIWWVYFYEKTFYEKQQKSVDETTHCSRFCRKVCIHDTFRSRFNGKERMKTVSVALILCLHLGMRVVFDSLRLIDTFLLGVEPPDPDQPPRPKDRAVLEAWVDPRGRSSQKASSEIGSNLQKNYARWQPRAR